MQNVISFKTKYGWVSIKERNNQILSISFGKIKNRGQSNNLKSLKKNIIDFFSKKTTKFNSNIVQKGSKLQIKIWKELKKIPYGKTKSYGEIARKVKTSPRYVGNVCGQNRLLLIVPCHRVVRSDGSLGGFSSAGGTKLKRKLLDLERN